MSASGTDGSAITPSRPPTGMTAPTSATRRRSTPAAGDSTAPSIFSVSTSATSSPTATSAPSSTSQSVSWPSVIDRPHLGMPSLVTPSVMPWPRPCRRWSADGVGDLGGAGDVRVLQRRAERRPACAARVTICGGALRSSKLFWATSATMSAAMPQRGLASSTTTSRPVFSTDSRIVSSSSGAVVRRSMISHSIPSAASSSAACCASRTMRPSATIVTSSPSRTRSASPNGIV